MESKTPVIPSDESFRLLTLITKYQETNKVRIRNCCTRLPTGLTFYPSVSLPIVGTRPTQDLNPKEGIHPHSRCFPSLRLSGGRAGTKYAQPSCSSVLTVFIQSYSASGVRSAYLTVSLYFALSISCARTLVRHHKLRFSLSPANIMSQ